MKKHLFLFFLIFGLEAQSAAMQALETDSAYIKAKDAVFLLKTYSVAMRQGAQQGAQYGAIAGAIYGGIYGFTDAPEMIDAHIAQGLPPLTNLIFITWISTFALVLSAIGAVLGATFGASFNLGKAGKLRFVLGKINNALSHTRYNFMTMPMNEAIMVYAVYQKNLLLMKKMKSPMHDFLNEKGVWEALTQLYFGIVTSENREKLKVVLE